MPCHHQFLAHGLGMRTSSFRSTSSDSSQAIVTLAQVRSGPRSLNEYVDSPRSQPILPLKFSQNSNPPSCPAPTVSGEGSNFRVCPQSSVDPTSAAVEGQVAREEEEENGGSSIITTQPNKLSALKEETVGVEAITSDGHSSIICKHCAKCRCAACTEPRDLPSQWCCGEKYELSVGKMLDCCTCFCCIQTVFYHCGNEEDNACYDDPCACGGSRCCSRWTCLAASSVFLPCLCLYWPARGCLHVFTSAYNSCRRKKGCQCSQRPTHWRKSAVGKNSQTSRRLLIESDSSSA